MVELSWLSRISRLAILSTAGLATGCSVVPRSRLDDCHKLSRTLESDKARLKDMLLSKDSQYTELAQRADDDARRLRVQADENERLQASVRAYQDERDQIASDYARVKSLLQASTAPISTSQLQRFERFAKDHPGSEFDPVSGILTLASDPMFEPGRDRLTPEGRRLLRTLATTLENPGAEGKAQRILVAGHTDDSPIKSASFQDDEPQAQGHLSLDRATRIRDQLTLETHLDRSQIEVAGFESSRPVTDGQDDGQRGRNRRIEIHLLGSPPPAKPSHDP